MAGSVQSLPEAVRPRGRLFRKYVVVIVALVAGLLVASGAVELWFSYQENKAALVALQREKALGAATRIEIFVREIEREMGWTTQPVLAAGPAALEQRRIDFLRLLRQMPPITELSHVDKEGREQLQVSRLAMDVIGEGRDLSGDPRFTTARAAKVYHGPVYFRKESEPYMALALAQSGGGVTVAEVNLKFIWDVVSQIAIGKAGRAFVVDGGGNLIAHPDISLVLQKTNLSRLGHVAAAIGAAPPGGGGEGLGERLPGFSHEVVAQDVAGRSVLTAHATIPGLKWAVVVEQPIEEAFAPIRASAQRTVVVAMLGVVLAVFASLLLARRMVRPIQALQAGAARIGAGELGHRIDVRTNDELQALAGEFNRMTAVLQESYATLEQRVVDRTAELTDSLEQQTATGEILSVISSSPTDTQPVFDTIVASCKRLLAARTAVMLRMVDGEAHLAAYTSTTPEADEQLRRFYPRPLDDKLAIALAVRQRAPFVTEDAETEERLHPEARALARVRGYRSLVIMPMLRQGEAIGAINVTREAGAFSDKDIALLQTFADQAVIAIENVRLFSELQERNAAVTEALEQQTATGEILRVISRSPNDLTPVFETIARSAAGLCDAAFGAVLRVENGRVIPGVTASDESAEQHAFIERAFPLPVERAGALGESVQSRQVVHIHDFLSTHGGEAENPFTIAQPIFGFRTVLVVPMVRDAASIGVILLWRREARPFTDKQVDLVRTFADQAVIAIENVRLFTELQHRNAEVSEALEQQTATAEILRVISSSPTDVQPVFDSIVANAVRLCGGLSAIAFRFDGETLVPVAKHGFDERAWEMIRRGRPATPSAETMSGRAFVERRVVHAPDILAEPVSERSHWLAREIGYRAFLAVPMMREGAPIGVINITRREPEAFSPKQIEVMMTFADQAVIAVENVRLFSELQHRNAEVSEALEQQTATAEILRVISSSPTDVQPVFEAIVASGVHLFPGATISIALPKGDFVRAAAVAGPASEHTEAWRSRFPFPLSREYMHGLAILERRMVDIADVAAGPAELTPGRTNFLASGYRAITIMPMLRGDDAIGALSVVRPAAGPLPEKQLAVLKTFADQAVIAIQNVRLFTELQQRNADVTEALEQQTATAEILRVISGSPTDVQPVLDVVAENAARVCTATDAVIRRVEGDRMVMVAHFGSLLAAAETPLGRTSTAGRAVLDRRTIQITDLQDSAEADGFLESRRLADLGGYRTVLATPLVRQSGGAPVGVIVVRRADVQAFTDKQIQLLETFADQAVIAIENVRLFTELQERTAQLQVANRHKDEFLANMSHELRTPLNAIIGFSEVMIERMFGDINEKQEEYLNDILSSGRHLLSLINDILDLSKIEAGRMELDLADFNLAVAIDNAHTLVHERAARRGLVLTQDVDEAIGDFRGDERKIKQVLLNLLSNAVKFTPEGGRVTTRAVLKGDVIEISVADTGVGIAPGDQEAVFEEFQQVGTDLAKKHEGTGLGLALARRFVELHGGNIWLESEVGVGSTFTFALPVRR